MPVSNRCNSEFNLVLKCLPIVAQEKCFALKGGTGINLFFQNLPRVSVDIDLVYLPIEDRAESFRNIDSALNRIGEKISISIPTAKFRPSYIEGLDTIYKFQIQTIQAQIKVESNTIVRGSVFEPEIRTLQPNVPAISENFSMNLVTGADIFAGKFSAAFERQNPRDFYDVHQFYKKYFVTNGLRNAFMAYLLSGKKATEERLSLNPLNLKTPYERKLKGMMIDHATLDEIKQAREKLVFDMVGRMPENHREFLFTFFEGNPDWSLVEAPNFESLPAVQWKLLNVKKMRPEKRREVLNRIERAFIEVEREIANYSGPDGPRSRYYQSSQEEKEIQNEKNEQRKSDYPERDFGSNDDHEQTADNDPYDGNPPTFSM